MGTLRPSVAYMPSGEAESDKFRNAQAWRQWYKTAKWRTLRWATLTRDMFTCQMCGKVEPDSSQLVADHRKPHRGREVLFFDEGNLWTLCKSPCHDKHKQRLEQALRRDGG